MLNNNRQAFTMIEVVFVIVVLGILAAIAIPRLAATRDDAQIAKGRSDVAAIRAAIVSERQGRLLQGQSSYIPTLDDGTSSEGQELFDGNTTNRLLQYPIISRNANGHWMKNDNGTYNFKILNTNVVFDYNTTRGTFNCSGTYCSDLTN